MNFQNMSYFLSVADEGSITKAAEHLNISQQALSNMIARLEEELDCKLFNRGKTLELTQCGREFYKSSAQILDIQHQTETAIGDINKSRKGELRIGISYTRGQAILPLLLPAFSQKYPNVDLQVVEGSTAMLEDSLEKGTIDVLIGFSPFMVENAETYEIMKERLNLVIPKSLLTEFFPGKESKVIEQYSKTSDLKIFKDCPFVLLKKGDRIRKKVDYKFHEAGVKPKIKIETENSQTAFALSSLGMGITVCPDLYLASSYVIPGALDQKMKNSIETCLFSEESSWDTIAIGYNKDRYTSQIAKDFIDMSLKVFKKQRSE